ncbi:MAG: biotin-dependent carboxyltransferase family protein [Vicinamibacterales bacterium]
MSLPLVDVVTPGLQTTVQDLGRWGHQAEGVPVAGAMDPSSHCLANLLVGNARSAASLEVTLAGPTLRFSDARRVAIAGAEFVVTLDGVVVPHGTAVAVQPGATLHFGERRSGARAYIAVEGGFDVAPVLGSRATHLPSGMGGVAGRALVRRDRLPLGSRGARLPGRGASAPGTTIAHVPAGTDPVRVRVLPGPHLDRFADVALEALTGAPYRIRIDANRMGYRLSGPRLTHCAGADIIPEATPIGSLQVPASGQPVLLMADRQTSGGYAKIATVIAADIPVVAQAAPGDRLLFEICTRAVALRALIERERWLMAAEPA